MDDFIELSTAINQLTECREEYKSKGGSQLAPLPTTCCGATNHSHGQFLNQLLAL